VLIAHFLGRGFARSHLLDGDPKGVSDGGWAFPQVLYFNRNPLFLWARDWTGIATGSNQTPELGTIFSAFSGFGSL
jgi:hypothetical protein